MGPSPSAATTLSHVASRRHPAHWATYWSLRSLRTGVCDVSRMVLGACAACRWCDGVVVWCGVVLLLCAVGAFGSVPLLCFSVRRLAFPSASPYARVPCARAVPCLPSCAIQPLPQPRVPPLIPSAYYAFHCERPHFHRAFERPSLRRRVPAARYVPYPVAQPTPYVLLRGLPNYSCNMPDIVCKSRAVQYVPHMVASERV